VTERGREPRSASLSRLSTHGWLQSCRNALRRSTALTGPPSCGIDRPPGWEDRDRGRRAMSAEVRTGPRLSRRGLPQALSTLFEDHSCAPPVRHRTSRTRFGLTGRVPGAQLVATQYAAPPPAPAAVPALAGGFCCPLWLWCGKSPRKVDGPALIQFLSEYRHTPHTASSFRIRFCPVRARRGSVGEPEGIGQKHVACKDF